MQMLFAAVLINTPHSTLKDAEITLRRISMNVAAHILFRGMFYGLVRGEIGVRTGVKIAFVGMQAGLPRDVVAHDICNRHFVRAST